MTITRQMILQGRETEYPLGALEANLLDLLDAANAFAQAYWLDTGNILKVNSGYRPGRFNRPPLCNGAKRSSHLFCLAIDWDDPTGEVDEWIQSHLSEMTEFGFVGIEHPDDTKGWAHTDLTQRYDQNGKPFQVFRSR